MAECALASVFVTHATRAVVVLASWCAEDVIISLSLDLPALGLEEDKYSCSVPLIPHVQPAAAAPASPTGPFLVPKDKGLVIVLEPI